jgi:FAD:protein FMN transferase
MDTVMMGESRRADLRIAVAKTIILVAGLICGGHGRASELIKFEDRATAMGSTFGVVLFGSDRETLQAAANAAFDEARRLDRLLSNYQPTSEWSAMNRDAGTQVFAASPELYQVVADCLRYHRESGGAFDISVGPLMKVWGFYKGEGTMPRPDEVTRALARVGSRHVRLDPAAHTIRFDRPDVELDPGGIGKGYAVDRMVDVLKAKGVTIALVSAGSSSIYGLGAPPDEPRGWRVTISQPEAPDRSIEAVFLKDASISTSGSYEKFFWADGKIWSHIMDPRTGYPARGASAVSVVAPRTIDSEAWTKAAFVNGRAWIASHTPKAFRVFFCDDAKPALCGWVGG